MNSPVEEAPASSVQSRHDDTDVSYTNKGGTSSSSSVSVAVAEAAIPPDETDSPSSASRLSKDISTIYESVVESEEDDEEGDRQKTSVRFALPFARRYSSVKRKQSLESRKNIPKSLIMSGHSAIKDDMTDSIHNNPSMMGGDAPKQGRLEKIFLNPSYPLRRQMLLTFGSVSLLTILIVVIVSILASVTAGNAIKETSYDGMEEWVDEFAHTTSRFVSEALSPKIVPTDLINLMAEIVSDRFAGYPTTEDDSMTPFYDIQSKTNMYPLKNNPLPLDWDFTHMTNEIGNVDVDKYPLHRRLSTAAAMYMMQGACDPNVTNPYKMAYYPNCTGANNNIDTGGDVASSPTNKQVYRKAADLSPFLKALYEYHDIMQLGFYFSNSGAGSTVAFPHYELDSLSSYDSIGCEWMRAPNPINPSLGPIGTDEEINRCHPEGTRVPAREYNPLEREWCREQALNPSWVHTVGPYKNAWSAGEEWLMTTGKAVYDRSTSAFICCIAADFLVDQVDQILKDVKVDELGILTLVRNDENGTVVVSSPKFDPKSTKDTITVDELSHETGVDLAMFGEIKSLVNFSANFSAFAHNDDDYIISAYPIPTVPEKNDSTYRPEYFAIFSLSKASRLTPIIDNVNDEVDDNVRNIVIYTVMSGVVGLAAVVMLIFATSSWFVEPLKWMNKVGDQVVGKFGEDLDTGIDYERKKSLPCSPQTELESLAKQFDIMVTRFSGEGTAKRTRMNEIEKVNLFDFVGDFFNLYRSREDSDFEFKFPTPAAALDAMGKSFDHCHLGPNTRLHPSTSMKISDFHASDHDGKTHKSPIFRWMVALIATPVLVTTVVISAVVLSQIYTKLPSLIAPVKEEYFALRESYRLTKTELLAIQATEVAEVAARDTHLLTRIASWLFFGGMELSGSFTEMVLGAEECKSASSSSECKWANDLPCDCAWNDFWAQDDNTCRKYNLSDSRLLQKVHFACQSQDTGPYGSRYNTTFFAKYPNMTSWWKNMSDLPGSSGEFSGSDYGTTYDRAKVISALSTVFIPLYNYDKSKDRPLGAFIGFEDDGALVGYDGCDHFSTTLPFWSSTEENGAARLRPELCPIGNHGFDARCRSWYDDGREKAKAGNGPLHLTGPYLFGHGRVVAQSVTSPLVDPENNKHIGQVLVDFLPDSTFKSLKSENIKLADEGFGIMITPESDILGSDTVVGPGYSLGEGGRSILDLLSGDAAFQTILESMKSGERGKGVFSRAENSQELIDITYAPVVVRSYRPLNSSDIASGVQNETTLVYSLALAETRSGILKSFQSISDVSSETVKVCIVVLSSLVIISTILIVYIALRVTKSMTIPILQLLDVMKDINGMRISNDDVTQLSNYKGSCREVDSVYKTMEMLYKVVQFANAAFFIGDLDVAYQVLRDALRLFTRLNNKKAIAVASNNLGNTMLTIYRTMKASKSEEMCGLSKDNVIAKGKAYFTLSIKLGETAYDDFYNKQGWSEECLVFMQFLANRYFNRAVFFLSTSCDDQNCREVESLGLRDLQIAMDMDVEIVDQCLEMGFKINRVERYELMMSRCRGLLALVELGYNPDDLSIDDQINDVYRDLKNAMVAPSHELFKEISVAGRMQKFDVVLMKYLFHAKNDIVNAARVAIRMLVEDEYVFPDAEREAINILMIYMESAEDVNSPKGGGSIAEELVAEFETLDHDYVERSTSVYSSGSRVTMRSLKSCSLGEDEDLDKKKSLKRISVLQSLRGDITMESF